MRPDFLQSEIQSKKKFYLSNIRSTCSKCNGEGMIINEDGRTYNDCPGCLGKFEKIKNYFDANISTEYLFLGLQDVKRVYAKECFEAYETLVKKINTIVPKYGILFTRFQDEYSYGVTTAGTLIVKIFVKLGIESYIINHPDLLDSFFSFSGEDKEISSKRAKLYDYLSNVQVLMIDNFGTENSKKESFANNKLLALLNSRKINNKITILCTDYSKDQLIARYEDGIVKFLTTNYINFQIRGGDGKYQRQAAVKFENDFPEMESLTKYLKPKTPKQEVKKEPVVESIPEYTQPNNEFDPSVDIAANPTYEQPKRGKRNGKGTNRES